MAPPFGPVGRCTSVCWTKRQGALTNCVLSHLLASILWPTCRLSSCQVGETADFAVSHHTWRENGVAAEAILGCAGERGRNAYHAAYRNRRLRNRLIPNTELNPEARVLQRHAPAWTGTNYLSL